MFLPSITSKTKLQNFQSTLVDTKPKITKFLASSVLAELGLYRISCT